MDWTKWDEPIHPAEAMRDLVKILSKPQPYKPPAFFVPPSLMSDLRKLWGDEEVDRMIAAKQLFVVGGA